MTLRELDTVVLLRDLPAHDLRRGDLGAIVTVLAPTRFTVEFVRVSGRNACTRLRRRRGHPRDGRVGHPGGARRGAGRVALRRRSGWAG
jgi:hypothetical protein